MPRVSLAFIRFYQRLLSPFVGNECRFHPTCSAYAETALKRHGALKGWWLTVRRILKCQPWSKGPWTDPVPERFAWRDFISYKNASKTKAVSDKGYEQ